MMFVSSRAALTLVGITVIAAPGALSQQEELTGRTRIRGAAIPQPPPPPDGTVTLLPDVKVPSRLQPQPPPKMTAAASNVLRDTDLLYDPTYDDLLDKALELGVVGDATKLGKGGATSKTSAFWTSDEGGDGPTFEPLTCNDGMMDDQEECYPSVGVPLSQLVNETAEGEEVVVPCGTCVYWDDLDEQFDIPGGLNVEGHLFVAWGASGWLRTTHVYVQGRLTIEAPPVGYEVAISLYGDDAKFFDPHPDNAGSCPEGGCEVGTRPFVLAGGTLDVHGLEGHEEEDCPRWVDAHDISTYEIYTNFTSSQFAVNDDVVECFAEGDMLLLAIKNADGRTIRQEKRVVKYVEGGIITLRNPLSENFDFTEEELDLYDVRVARLTRRVAIFSEYDEDEHGGLTYGIEGDDGTSTGGNMLVSGTVEAFNGVEISNFDPDVPIPSWVELLTKSVVY